MQTQFIVQLDNRPGALAKLAHAMAARGVNLEHLAGGGAGAKGYAAFSADDDGAVEDVLRGLGQPYVRGDAFVVDLPDQPGALAEIAERLARAGMTIHGLFVVGRGDGLTSVALGVDDATAARRVLGFER